MAWRLDASAMLPGGSAGPGGTRNAKSVTNTSGLVVSLFIFPPSP
jgi:hypothetical protein